MNFKKICQEFNFRKQCREYGVSLWQCPSFLFLIMGLIIIISMLGTYLIANVFTTEPEMVALTVIIITLILFVIGYSIVDSFDRLAKINKMKSEFVSVVSHQLRTPLSNLKWSLNFLMSGALGNIKEKQLDYLKMIKTNNERMIKLINNLLDVNRIESNSLRMGPYKEASLVEIIEDVIKDLSPLAKASNIKINFQAEPNLPKIKIDEERIRLVIFNLVDNSIKYIKGKGEVNIKLIKQNNFLKVIIKDNGVGIPKEQQNQVFQKFFRANNIMRHQVVGSGLGLFIAKAIVEASKGKIGFESKENQGSTFWFTLPIKK